jgi:hypothetical protein
MEVKLWVPRHGYTACERSPECNVEVGHLQAKFIGHFSPHIVPPSRLLGSLEGKLETSKFTGLQLQFTLLRRRGRAYLVDKVGMSNKGDSAISHIG